MRKDLEIQGEWRDGSDGKVFEASAVDPASGRVLARATCTVPGDVGTDLIFYLGRECLDEVERSVRAVCQRPASPELG